MPGLGPGIHVLLPHVSKTWMAPQLGLARVAQLWSAESRVNPTFGDKPGHDGSERGAGVIIGLCERDSLLPTRASGRRQMNAGMDGTIDTRRLIFPALGDFYQSVAPYSYAIIRFCAGVF